MKVYVDTTEPGTIYQALKRRCDAEAIDVQRTLLHKRRGQGGQLRDTHPFYGLGADYVVTDRYDIPYVGIERKTLPDLARSAGIEERVGNEIKIFRQLKDLAAHPTPILLLEGKPNVLYKRVEPALLGLQFWCAREGIAVMFSTTPLSSANAVFFIARKLRAEVDPVQELAATWDQPQASDTARPAPRATTNEPRGSEP